MSYVPGCRYDLFISYAIDNNHDGWVDQFVSALGQELNDLLGRKFLPRESVFFDKRALEAAQSFPIELAAAARDSAILLPILSPGYLTSNWCDRERAEFFSRLPDGAASENCLAPILLRPIEESDLDTFYRVAQRLSFLGEDAQTPLAPGSAEWTRKVRLLAGQLKNALQRLRRGCKPVFIGKAGASDRLQNLRAWCCKELESRHYRTVPEYLNLFNDPDAVRDAVTQAGLAVHFIGGADSASLEAMDISAAVCAGPTILYQPFGVDLSPDERLWLPDFESQLPATSGRYQRLSGKNDQELLALIDEQITTQKVSRPNGLTLLQLALVCEELDLIAVQQLKEAIVAQRSIEVDFPSFVGARLKPMERLRKWQDFLTRGQALVFYHGLTERERLEPIWLKAGQDNPLAQRSWYVAEPELDSKRKKNPDALSSPDQVIGLLERLRSSS